MVSPRHYKPTNGHIVPRLNGSGKRIVPLNPPTEGADTFYDPVPVDKYKEKDTSFRFDKACRYNDPVEKEFARLPAAKYYSLPAPEVYKETGTKTPKWGKETRAGSRFGFQMKPQGADTYYHPVLQRHGSAPNLSGGGPRLDDKMYMRTAGADAPFYALPHPTIYKERSTTFRFGRDVSTGADPAFTAIPEPNKVDPDAPVPTWVSRLAAHNPRPVRPWTAPKSKAEPRGIKTAKQKPTRGKP